jgi:D-arabinose 1-dehydrogenase-like Zn-dependent alcohol dehydrogenase
MSKLLEINSIAFMKDSRRGGMLPIKSTATGPQQKRSKAIEFAAKHEIKSQLQVYKLEQINEMIELMKTGQSMERMAVVF